MSFNLSDIATIRWGRGVKPMTDSCSEPQNYCRVRVLGHLEPFYLQEDIDDRQLRHRDHQVESGSDTDD